MWEGVLWTVKMYIPAKDLNVFKYDIFVPVKMQ